MLTQTPSSRKEALVTSGTRDMSVSRQWSSRPSDQRFLSLDDLYNHTLTQGLASRAELVSTKAISIEADCQSPEGLTVSVGEHRHTPSHWSFGQLCAMVGAPAGY